MKKLLKKSVPTGLVISIISLSVVCAVFLIVPRFLEIKQSNAASFGARSLVNLGICNPVYPATTCAPSGCLAGQTQIQLISPQFAPLYLCSATPFCIGTGTPFSGGILGQFSGNMITYCGAG